MAEQFNVARFWNHRVENLVLATIQALFCLLLGFFGLLLIFDAGWLRIPEIGFGCIAVGFNGALVCIQFIRGVNLVSKPSLKTLINDLSLIKRSKVCRSAQKSKSVMVNRFFISRIACVISVVT